MEARWPGGTALVVSSASCRALISSARVFPLSAALLAEHPAQPDEWSRLAVSLGQGLLCRRSRKISLFGWFFGGAERRRAAKQKPAVAPACRGFCQFVVLAGRRVSEKGGEDPVFMSSARTLR